MDENTSKLVASAQEKAKNRVLTKINAMTESDSMLGPAIPEEPDTRTMEEQMLGDAWERSAVSGSNPNKSEESFIVPPAANDNEKTPAAAAPANEVVTGEQKDEAAAEITPDVESVMADPEYEKAQAEWKEAREQAHKLEREYQDKYAAHIKEESKGWRFFANLPRKMLGIQPKLTAELKALQDASLAARRKYREAGKKLKETKLADGKSIDRAAKIAERYQRMLAYHLTVGVHKSRLEIGQQVASEAWANNKIRPVLEKINKYKYARIGAMTIGYATLAGLTGGLGAAAVGGGAYLSRIAAAMGLGATVGMGGQALYVESARRRLKEARENVGEDFFRQDFAALDKSMGSATFAVSAREAQVRTAAALSGLAAGLATGPSSDILDNTQPTPADAPGLSDTPTSGSDNPTGVGLTEAERTAAFGPVVGPSIEDLTSNTTENPQLVPLTEAEKFAMDNRLSDLVADNSPHIDNLTPLTESERIVAEGPIIDQAAPDQNAPHIDNFRPLGEAETYAAGLGETMPDTNASVSYTVEKGDNVWNILEGKGPDANPVGGQSEVLHGMTMADRQEALDKLVEYYENHPEEAKAAGVIKSDGNIHKVYPGEELNISVFDAKLREILGLSADSTAEAPTDAGAAPAADYGEFPGELRADGGPGIVAEGQLESTDINQMKVEEVLDLQRGVTAGDQAALERLEALGLDPAALQQLVNNIFETGMPEPVNGSLTVEQYFNNMPEASSPAVPDQGSPDIGGPLKPEASDQTVMEASGDLVRNYVNNVEKGTRGFIFAGQPDVSGTFEELKGMTLGEFKALAASDNLQAALADRGVSYDGFERWGQELQARVAVVPGNDSETLEQYVTRIANVRPA